VSAKFNWMLERELTGLRYSYEEPVLIRRSGPVWLGRDVPPTARNGAANPAAPQIEISLRGNPRNNQVAKHSCKAHEFAPSRR
jgi:hypothetical protein